MNDRDRTRAEAEQTKSVTEATPEPIDFGTGATSERLGRDEARLVLDEFQSDQVMVREGSTATQKLGGDEPFGAVGRDLGGDEPFGAVGRDLGGDEVAWATQDLVGDEVAWARAVTPFDTPQSGLDVEIGGGIVDDDPGLD